MWFSDSHQNRTIFYFPVNIELRLINLVKAGMAKQCNELFDYIVSKNIVERSLSTHMKTQFFNELSGTYLKILEQIDDHTKFTRDDEPVLSRMIFNANNGNGFDILRELYLSICTCFHENRKGHGEKRKRGIIEYIDGRYKDKMLCLAAISNHFKLSESYFSRFFKEQFGETFSSYLEKFRIDRAKQLLISTDLSVDMIGGKTGYCNTRSFRRAFKRITGINPKSYKILS